MRYCGGVGSALGSPNVVRTRHKQLLVCYNAHSAGVHSAGCRNGHLSQFSTEIKS